MGTDIHAIAEFQDHTGVWRLAYEQPVRVRLDQAAVAETPFLARQYGLFALLAGVRNRDGIQPLEQPRGLPENMSPQAERYDWDWCHGHTWYTADEIRAARENPAMVGTQFLAWFDYVLWDEDRPARIILAFDS